MSIRAPGKVQCIVLRENRPTEFYQEYHTGTLYLGYFNGPTEGVLISCTIHLISAIFGELDFVSTKPLSDVLFCCVYPLARSGLMLDHSFWPVSSLS